MNISTKNRFFRHVIKTQNCWLWKGATVRGYGNFGVNGKTQYAHRYSYQLVNGPIPDEKDICHYCDNPICVNPAHLWCGSARENMHDASLKGRMVRGERHPSAKLSVSDVKQIRILSKQYSQVIISKMFGVSHQSINSIVNRETWAWLS